MMAVLFFVLLLLEAVGAITNPYIGLVMYVTVPILFIVGLLLIPIGTWRAARRRRLNPEGPDWPTIDFNNPRQRTLAVIILMLTVVNILIVSLAAYGGVHYMDSSEFCGEVCHTTMEPQYKAYQVWPHARVECAQCHVGPGAKALIQAKLAGTRQLFHVITGNIPKPVPPPPELIRPATYTCERCHWPEKFHGDKPRVIREYSNDEPNTESTTKLTLHIGGGRASAGNGTGIHWHMNLDNVVEFAEGKGAGEKGAGGEGAGDKGAGGEGAGDKGAGGEGAGDGTIPYVRVTDRQGRVREFVANGKAASEFSTKPLHRMDCMDCHNRPAHTMFFTAERAIDTGIAQGRIPRELPFVRREAVVAVKADYANHDAAMTGIEKHLRDFYAQQSGADAQAVARAVTGAQQLWGENVFPAMKVTWGTYPSNIGHVDTPGCFRCHDDEHKAADGVVIKQDCELCHTAPE
jgi:nitrate/TMAO reductase-like tetraheme cytochrome c subunit